MFAFGCRVCEKNITGVPVDSSSEGKKSDAAREGRDRLLSSLSPSASVSIWELEPRQIPPSHIWNALCCCTWFGGLRGVATT
ncbi:hypothetical protein TNCV_929661 [Trichonephila clavipes]|nr:hypothetical protein TNCV_929661 [Trichonephila clavipes]